MQETWSTRVAAEIRAEMARRKLSQRALSTLAGTSTATMSRWLSGEKALDLENLETLSRALNVSVVDLVSWGEMDPALRSGVGVRARRDSNSGPSDYRVSLAWCATRVALTLAA